jgi:hypothetical protein
MRRDRTPLVGVALVLLARGVAAAPPTERFHGTLRGGLSIAGNTLGLSKAILENGPGTADGIGTFMTTNPGLVDDSPLNPSNPWFPGTTNSYTLNSSASDLRLPASATVLYAELVWAGSTHYGSSDVRTLLDSPVVSRRIPPPPSPSSRTVRARTATTCVRRTSRPSYRSTEPVRTWSPAFPPPRTRR